MCFTLLTVCSNRKTKTQERIRAGDLPTANQTELSARWSEWVTNAPAELLARELYRGRGFSEAKKTADKHHCDLRIVSAGLGLIPVDQPVPGYDLTIANGSANSIANRLKQGCFDTAAWWWTLAGQRWPIRDMVRSQTERLIVISLPSTYLPLVEHDLASLTPTELNRLRLIGPRPGKVPAALQSIYMPYDFRFDGPDSPLPGTQSDFPQRTARHFIDTIASRQPTAPASEHAAAVADALRDLRHPVRSIGQRSNDLEIKKYIDDFWEACQGRSGDMLRLFRDRLNIACEQRRFQRLFQEVKIKRTNP